MEKVKVRIFDLVKDDLVEENRYGLIDLDFLVALIEARMNQECRIIIDLNH